MVVTPPSADAPVNEARLPLFLTNARKTGALARMEKAWALGLDRAVSQAYLRALFESGGTVPLAAGLIPQPVASDM